MRITMYATAALLVLLAAYVGSYLLVSDYRPSADGGSRSFRSMWAAHGYGPLLAAESAICGVPVDAYVHN